MSDSSMPIGSSQSEPSSLETGLTALRRQDYPTAIACLEAVCQAECDRVTLAKAQMGLVKAYRRSGAVQQARRLCETLSQNPSRTVQAWGAENLAKLGDVDSQPSVVPVDPQSDRTGFTPLAAVPMPTERQQIELPEVIPPDSIAPDGFENPFYLSDRATLAEPTRADAVHSASPVAPEAASLSPVRSADRAQKWTSLGKLPLGQLVALEIGTAIALVWLVHTVVVVTLTAINHQLARALWPIDLREWAVFYHISPWPTVLILAGLFAIAPLLLDAVFRQFYGLKALSLSEFERYSPEASRLLRRVCSQQRLPMPQLGLLPVEVPIALTYGNLPRSARIVFSRGLLTQLNEAEIAAICAGELAHVRCWDFAPLTLAAAVTQIFYQVYWQVAEWGDRSSNSIVRATAAVVAAVSYGLYWLGRWPGLWLARIRQYYSDRIVCDLTGNPNGLAQALLKLTQKTAIAIQQQGSTHPLIESCDFLLPTNPRAAVSDRVPVLQSALPWEVSNPARHWLTFNNSQLRLGDRLLRLAGYARQWRLTPAFDLHSTPVRVRRLSLQAAPLLGVLVGLAIALLLWGVGAMADWFDWLEIDWLKGDRGLLWGLMLIGFSVGTLLRINAFFPDIRSTNLQDCPSLMALLSDPAKLPVDSQPVRLRGKLLGRSGIGNWLVQDLLLQTEDGLVKLHYLSPLGTAGNLLLHPQRPDLLVQRSVTVTGWFRRGATPWIDVDSLQPQRGAAFRSGHPLWSTLLAIATALLGILCILRS